MGFYFRYIQGGINVYHKNMADKLKKALTSELKAYRKRGVELMLNARQASPKEIVAACTTAEEGSYMRDYECDDNGRISRLNFQHVLSDR